MQASRATIAAHPEYGALEVWSTLSKSLHARPPYVYTKGSTVRSAKSVVANLDVGGFPCAGRQNAVQSFAWSLSHNEGLCSSTGRIPP